MSSPQLLAPPHRSRVQIAPPIPLRETSSHSPETTYRDFEAELQAFDFERFFAMFPLDSPVCRFIECFSLSSLHDQITLATAPSSSLSVQLRARRELDAMLGEIDGVLHILVQAQFDVQRVRDTLVWLRAENTRALRAGESLISSTVSPSSNGPRWASKPPPQTPMTMTYNNTNPPQTSPRNPVPYWERYPRSHGPPSPARCCPTCAQVYKTVSGAEKFIPEVHNSSSWLRRGHG